MLKPVATDIEALKILDERLRWLSAWTIHHANHIRENEDGLKVGGHQASCASMTAIMAALYFHALGPNDRVAVKPHAGPVLHAIHYLLGSQSREALENFRGFGGAQSYPSRTKDRIPVDFSTGSVGLGVAITLFASLVQDYLTAHGWMDEQDRGRFVALIGDAELDEGNIYEALIEGAKHDVRNLWWIVDYNRQSLDATSADRMFERFDEIFASCGWRVETLKYGKLLEAAFLEPGGKALRDWIDRASNADYAALTYLGGKAWRERLLADAPKTRAIVDKRSDDELHRLMTNLAGHDLESLIEAFDRCDDDRPTLFIAYTIKGFGLPFAGHKDNHAGLMNPTQIAALRESMGVREGHEWEPLEGVGGNARPAVEALLEKSQVAREKRPRALRRRQRARDPRAGGRGAIDAGRVRPHPARSFQSRRRARGPDRHHLARRHGLDQPRRLGQPARPVPPARNGRCFRADQRLRQRKSGRRPTKASTSSLGIAESNLFLMLAAAGLSGDLFGQRLFPIGTLYDPFIARGLDALNYACYQDARFLLVATPSGITLGPEGGAHQSINPPLIALGQPGLRHYEPAFADELALMMEEAFRLIDDPAGESTYLRLSTRSIRQVERSDDRWRDGALQGGYWLREPGPGAEAAIVAMGAVMPEALAAWEELREDIPGLGLLAITSPDLLHRGWTAAQAGRWNGERRPSHIEQLLSVLAPATPASSPSPTPRLRRSRGSAAWSVSASHRSASRNSARPEVSPNSIRPIVSTATAITEAAAEILLPFRM